MSMITGCPACGTLFKVVPDQLKISEGWVRCGHCGEVFDATARLQAEAADEASSAPAAAAPVEAPRRPAAAAQSPADAAAQPPQSRLAPVDAPGSRPTAARRPAAVARPAAAPEPVPPAPVVAPTAAPMPAPVAAIRPAGPPPAEDSIYPPIELVRAEVESRNSRFLIEDDDEAVFEDLSFVRSARRRSVPRPGMRLLLAVLALALAVVLAGQWALQERDQLAVQHPAWRPWLERLCEPLGCRIGPPRRIEAILIDSSGFTRLRQDAYRLSFTLKNQARQPVAVPALELTLTDTQDQPLLRRVLAARELGAPSDLLAAGAEWSASVAIQVQPGAGDGRVAGYRLLAFYP